MARPTERGSQSGGDVARPSWDELFNGPGVSDDFMREREQLPGQDREEMSLEETSPDPLPRSPACEGPDRRGRRG